MKQFAEQIKGLVRVSRIEAPEAALLSPEQGFFLRENLKLKLLNARLGLLARQKDAARADLASAAVLVRRYADASSRKTTQMLQLLEQSGVQLKASEIPRLDESLAALTTAACRKVRRYARRSLAHQLIFSGGCDGLVGVAKPRHRGDFF